MNYLIKYTVEDKNGAILKSGTMRAKNKCNSLEAQIKFEEYLKKRYFNFGKLIVHNCTEDNMFNIFGDIF